MNAKRFDFDVSNDVTPGSLLIATSRLHGSAFERSVVLLMHADPHGVVGVTINKPANSAVKRAWQQLTGTREFDPRSIVAGGPLHGPVFALHQLPSLSDVALTGGLYMSAEVDKLQQLMNQLESPYRIVVGVAGWRSGQLRAEIDAGMWYSIPLDVATIFEEADEMWSGRLREYGWRKTIELIGAKHLPSDPQLN